MASPVGIMKPFWDPDTATSTPQASVELDGPDRTHPIHEQQGGVSQIASTARTAATSLVTCCGFIMTDQNGLNGLRLVRLQGGR